MASIDTSTIEGFDDLSPEQKVEALLKLDIPERVDMSLYVPKETADKYASEAADWKKKYNGKLSEDEKAKAEAEEKQKESDAKYAELLRKSTIAEHTAKYIALGYSEKMARETAEALYDGDMDKVFENHQKASEEKEKQIVADYVKRDPKPGGAGGGDGGEPDNVKWARERAKQRNEAMKAGNDNMKKFML